jgi:hypothetical protein
VEGEASTSYITATTEFRIHQLELYLPQCLRAMGSQAYRLNSSFNVNVSSLAIWNQEKHRLKLYNFNTFFPPGDAARNGLVVFLQEKGLLLKAESRKYRCPRYLNDSLLFFFSIFSLVLMIL